MRHRIRFWLLSALAAVASPLAASADIITLNVPVTLTQMAPNVTRGAVRCHARVTYATSGMRQTVTAEGLSSGFVLSTNGTYNGTETVRVQLAPPRDWIERMQTTIEVFGTPDYVCVLQVGIEGGGLHPRLTGDPFQKRIHPESPDWAMPRAGSNPVVTGTLQVPR